MHECVIPKNLVFRTCSIQYASRKIQNNTRTSKTLDLSKQTSRPNEPLLLYVQSLALPNQTPQSVPTLIDATSTPSERNKKHRNAAQKSFETKTDQNRAPPHLQDHQRALGSEKSRVRARPSVKKINTRYTN